MYKIKYRFKYNDEDGFFIPIVCSKCDYEHKHNMCIFIKKPEDVPTSYIIVQDNLVPIIKRKFKKVILNSIEVINRRRRRFLKFDINREIENITEDNINNEFEIII